MRAVPKHFPPQSRPVLADQGLAGSIHPPAFLSQEGHSPEESIRPPAGSIRLREVVWADHYHYHS